MKKFFLPEKSVNINLGNAFMEAGMECTSLELGITLRIHWNISGRCWGRKGKDSMGWLAEIDPECSR